MTTAVAATGTPAWDWPYHVPAELLQQAIDVRSVLLLERSDRPFWRAFQERALGQLGTHCVQASPWWRQWLAAVNGRLSLDTLATLPVLRRADFRASVESAGALPLPAAHGQTTGCATSGSSGTPAQFHVSAWTSRLMGAHYLADWARHGLALSRPLAAIISRAPPHPDAEHVFTPADPARGFGPQYLRLNVRRSMRAHAQWLGGIDPAYLNTPPPVLWGMLQEWEGGVPAPRNLRHVFSIGETVWPELRAQARRVLGARILDRYTCEEIGPIALQCPVDDERYHVCVSNAVVEVVDDAGVACAEGVAGSVLVTGLHQWASPVVRYELGDIARLHTGCTCGARVPSLSSLLGRKRFLLRLPDGERVYVNINAIEWLAAAPVREHRLTQVGAQEMRVEVVMDHAITPTEHAALLAMLRHRVHPDMSYDLRQVQAIAWAPGGKRQDLVCLV